MNDDDFGIRDGEIAVELPAQFDASLYYIGRIRTPWKRRDDCPKNARESDAVCTLEVDPRWAQALTGRRDLQPPGRALLDEPVAARPGAAGAADTTASGRGTFALRSPARPNPIAMSVVKLARGRGHQAFGGRPRLPRRHAAHRHQALFRLHRRLRRRRGGVAPGPQGLTSRRNNINDINRITAVCGYG